MCIRLFEPKRAGDAFQFLAAAYQSAGGQTWSVLHRLLSTRSPSTEEGAHAPALAQQRLYLRPLPHGHGSLRLMRSERGRIAASRAAAFH